MITHRPEKEPNPFPEGGRPASRGISKRHWGGREGKKKKIQTKPSDIQIRMGVEQTRKDETTGGRLHDVRTKLLLKGEKITSMGPLFGKR